MKQKKLVYKILIGIQALILAFSNFNFLKVTTQVNASSGIDENEANSDYVDNLRYGFNVTAGKTICDDGLNIANPILESIENGLLQYITKNESNTKTEAGNFISDSAIGIAEQSGKIYSGGINAKIAAVNMDIDGVFDTNSSSEKIYSERYETYYQNINRLSYVIQGNVDLRNYLTEDFKSDLYSVRNTNDATWLMNKYGTHLFTGFQYGGMLQVSNYVRTENSNSNLNQMTSLSTKMQTAFKSYGGGVSFNFSESYMTKEQEAYGTSNYKVTMYGGESVTAVSLDQLFTYNASALDGKGNYVYDRWVNSINDAKNLAIVGTPSSARIIPLWELLPSDEYMEVKGYLVEAYRKMCGDKYDYFMNKYPSNPRKIDYEESTGFAEIKGYSLTYKGNNFYYDIDANSESIAYANSEIHMNYSDTIDYDEKKWEVTYGSQYVDVVDSKNGIFKVKSSAINNSEFVVSLYSNNSLLFNRSFTIFKGDFSGGDGTKSNPYLISNKDDFEKLTRESSLWGKHFKLTNNIDFNKTTVSPIGEKQNPFTGTIDGNYCKLTNLQITNPSFSSLGLFAYNSGTIQNLFVENVNIGYVEEEKAFESSIEYVGTIVGYNKGGTINNCKVSNAKIYSKYLNQETATMNVGGLVGYSGPNNTESASINKSSIDKLTIIGIIENSNKDYDGTIFVGGLIGTAKKTKISDTYVRNIDEIYGKVVGQNSYVYVSGSVSNLDEDSNLTNSVVDKITYIGGGAEKKKDGLFKKYTALLNKNTLIGSKHEKSSVSNCYTEKYFGLQTGVSEGCTEQDKVTLASASKLSYNVWCKNTTDDSPVLIEQTFSNSPLLINTDNAKTEYFYGEPFNISGITVQGRFSNSDELIKVNSFSYDSSKYNPNAIGTYSISVSALGHTTSFNVTVRKIDVVGLHIEPLKDTFYVGEEIDENDYKVSYVLENGQKLDVASPKLSYVEYPSSSISIEKTKYVYGNNLVTANCDNIKGELIVNAVEKELSSIEISSFPEKTTYKQGETFNSNGMVITATYANGDKEIVNNEELEIIGDKIVSGANTIIISYGPYVTCEIIVSGIPTYDVVFKNWDGSIISSNKYTQGDNVVVPSNVTKPSDNTYYYEFIGWNTEVENVCNSSKEYIAQFEAKYIDYTVVFKDNDGSIITSKNYHYGDLIEYPTVNNKEVNGIIYKFKNWSISKQYVDGNLEIIANYTTTENENNNDNNDNNNQQLDNTNTGIEWWEISVICGSSAALLFAIWLVLKKIIKK